MRFFKQSLFLMGVFLTPFFIFSRTNAMADDVMFNTIQSQMQEMRKMIQSLQTTVQTQNDLIERQNVRIEKLETGGVAPQHIAAPQSVPAAPGAPRLAGLSQGFNPDIGVTGTVQAKLTQNSNDGDGNDTIALKELELHFGQYVDPYSRFDAIVSFNDALEDQNVSIEEAYYTHWGLPFGFLGQIGKFRSKIGKQNLLHAHQLDTVDYPLVIQDFFGEEGLAASGARLQHSIPLPLDIPLEITGEILRGNEGPSFSGVSRHPIFTTHAKTFFEMSKDANLELGATAMFGDENPPHTDFIPGDPDLGTEGMTVVSNPHDGKGQDRYGVHIFGGDATFLWNLPEERKLKWQSEMFIQERSKWVTSRPHPWGAYSLVDFRFSPQFSTGIRVDYLEPRLSRGTDRATVAFSPYLTFWQSEFADFRLQFSHTNPADHEDKVDNAIYLKANILIGAHKHPIQ